MSGGSARPATQSENEAYWDRVRRAGEGGYGSEPHPNPNVEALLDVLRRRPGPPPDPAIEERATIIVLLERCRPAGFPEGQAATLVHFLPREKVVEACELVEAGCDPHTAGLIVF